MESKNMSSNVEFDGDIALISVNPRIYPLDVVYYAAYSLLDRAYVLLDGDPKEEIIAEIKPKREQSIEQLATQFNEELLNYSVYKSQIEKNNAIRQVFIQRALLTNGFEIKKPQEDFIGDPEGIAIPWENKYGKKNANKKLC
jgi:His-Xaa-Ser system protein HxsD